MRRALIVGHEGQDGRLMSAHLRAQGYEVAGWGKRGCEGLVGMASGGFSIGDPKAVSAVMEHWRPDEVYHFAAHHHSSEQLQEDTVELFRQSVEVNLMSLVHFLQAASDHLPAARLFYAVSSRIFGAPVAGITSEVSAFDPQCPYGITKVAGLPVLPKKAFPPHLGGDLVQP